MNENLVNDLKCAINDLKIDILKKQEELVSLIEKYEELTGEEIED